MNYEMIDCIDAGTPYCPCHLAETNECILCSQLQGKEFCDCKNWKGTCIYQELIWNNNESKAERETYKGVIVQKREIEKGLVEFVIETNHELCKQLCSPGSYAFLRTPETTEYFDVPISIVESDIQKNRLLMIIEIEGIKTKKIYEKEEGDTLLVKGPFWNGVLGLKNVGTCKNKNVLLVARAIGLAPMIPVLKKLYRQNNNISLVIDKGKYEDVFIKDFLRKYPCNVLEIETLYKGDLTQGFGEKLEDFIGNHKVGHIHISGPDILILQILKNINGRTKTSCCNNAKMCCGQGVCGACTTRFEGHVVKRLCKLQTDPEYIFEGRRNI